MKNLQLFFATIFLITGTVTQAQSSAVENASATIQADKQNNNYALLVRNINHVKTAVKTAGMMTEENPNAVDKFEVIICGRKITEISEHKSPISNAQNKGITFTACGMSMNNFSMDKENLPGGVEVVKNGLIRIYDLQEKEYKTITL